MSLIHTPGPEDDGTADSGVPVAAWLVVALMVLLGAAWWMTRDAPVRPEDPPVRASGSGESERTEADAPSGAGTGAPAVPVRPTPARRGRGRADDAAEAAPAARPAPRTVLKVTSDVPGAFVFIDRRFAGITPLETDEVDPGDRVVNVSAEGYDGASARVRVEDGATTEVRLLLKEVRLDAAVDVVHKHRLGSCEGRLTANPQHLRYTPTDGNDAFVITLATIETFSVDYLGKTLTLKMRDGKTWNFTTRAPNADPLFVFHREVERARERLREMR